MGWLDEFGPEFEVPTEILNIETIMDNSWHNDVCPSFTDEAELVQLWVDHPDPERRELDRPRFSVQHWIEPEESGDPYSGYAEVFVGDDVNEAIRVFVTTVQERRRRA